MGVLKSFFVLLSMVLLHACTGKVRENPKPDETPAATTVAQPQGSTKTLPSFTVRDASGNTLDLQTFKGKKVFVNLWATWCPPCRSEMPSIEKLYQAANKENAQFVMLSLDNDFETAKKYVQKNSLSLPIFSPAGDVPELFTVNGIPTTFIFDEQGQLIAQHEGSEDYNTPEFRKLFGAVQ
jgi:thiol-disulfide isomerase/thioredoxin